MADDAQTLFRTGRLADAIAAQTAAIRAAPGATELRYFLAELLCFTEDFERADRMLDIMASQEAEWGPAVAAFRHILRGEETRRQVLAEGRAPQFVGDGMAGLKPVVEALMLLRLGRAGEAAECLAADAERPLAGTRNGAAFAEFRDLDDVLARVIEIITPTGDYCWTMAADVVRLELQPLARPRDLIWRPAAIGIRGGYSGPAWVPALYFAAGAAADDDLRLGRRTDWVEEPGAPVRGRGQRLYLVDDEDVPIHELGDLAFAPPSEPA